MFTYNGIVYGGKPDEQIKIDSLKILPDKIMILTFSTGEERLFDATLLKGEVFQSLDEEEIFRSAVIDHGVVTWKNGEIDCSPEFMYDNSYEYASPPAAV